MPRWCGSRTGPKGLALTADVTPRYCAADPSRAASRRSRRPGATSRPSAPLPLALTDNLNFGNPEKPEAMGELVGCIQGIGEAARALDFPIVSGNVSLYNETGGRGILPTPTIGGVGLVDDVARVATLGFQGRGRGGAAGRRDAAGWLGQSLYLRDICGRAEGAPPPVDLAAEKRNGDFVRGLMREGRVSAVHDLSDGGLAGRPGRDDDARRHRRDARSAAGPRPEAHCRRTPLCSARIRAAIS